MKTKYLTKNDVFSIIVILRKYLNYYNKATEREPIDLHRAKVCQLINLLGCVLEEEEDD